MLFLVIMLKLSMVRKGKHEMSITTEQTLVQVTFDDIIQDLCVYLQRVESDETLVIFKAGKPLFSNFPRIRNLPRQHRRRHRSRATQIDKSIL